MDAAGYISTLDGLRILNQEPLRTNYAVIDLAVDDRFLQYLYESDKQGNIHWKSLLEETRWQSGWHAGPVLLEFEEDPGFGESLRHRLSNFPLGVLIETAESFSHVFQWAQGWLMALADSDERLFRFYDPRSFRPLLAILSEASRDIVGSGTAVYWSHRGEWLAWVGADANESESLPERIRLSPAELLELPNYRMADRAIDYARIYRNHIPANFDSGEWVMEQLLDASRLGFLSASQQERWLRLRLRKEAPLLTSPVYKDIMKTPGMTPVERLNAMESIMEPANAKV